MLPAAKPLTKQALEEHILLLESQEAAARAPTSQRSANCPASPVAFPQISGNKLVHIFDYLTAQRCMTQESLPITNASHESLSEKDGCLAGLRAEVTTSSRRKGKGASARKSLHMPVAVTRSRAPQPGEITQPLGGDRGFLSHLTSICAMPTSGIERRKHLGIFNHGKAVASRNTTSGAFSETDFMQSANISRVRLDKRHDSGCGDDMDVNKSPKSRPLCMSSRDSILEGAAGSAHSTRNHDSNASRRNSVAGHNESAGGSEQLDICPGDDSAAIDGEGIINSWHGPTSSAGESRDAAVSIPDCNRSFYPESPFVPQSWPQGRHRQERYTYDTRTPVEEQDSWAADEHAEVSGESLLFIADSYDAIPAPGASHLHNSHLLQSINECLEEDVDQDNAPLPSRSSEQGGDCSIDVGFLLSRSEVGMFSPFDLHNPSFGANSAFGSSFFASQDLVRQRCTGEATVSDFGASRCGLNYASAYVSPTPAQALEGANSFDTLPEYVSRTELPPPYSFLGHPPPQPSNNSSGFLREHRHFNRSRAHINMMTGSTRRDRAGRSDSAAEARRGRGVTTDSHGSTEFRYYPRRMN
ncbi:hypothetical protein GGH94_003633 [Coemansia aciculifera]|uniref:Uncharacterized protein n=1 Tax=Coemansia aciculifera TaxID=417176 RepID=A0A9W8ILV4_9FUNG|nr:hypothetical protein GGH94_003633 [Coemansia aciculifera]